MYIIKTKHLCTPIPTFEFMLIFLDLYTILLYLYFNFQKVMSLLVVLHIITVRSATHINYKQ